MPSTIPPTAASPHRALKTGSGPRDGRRTRAASRHTAGSTPGAVAVRAPRLPLAVRRRISRPVREAGAGCGRRPRRARRTEGRGPPARSAWRGHWGRTARRTSRSSRCRSAGSAAAVGDGGRTPPRPRRTVRSGAPRPPTSPSAPAFAPLPFVPPSSSPAPGAPCPVFSRQG